MLFFASIMALPVLLAIFLFGHLFLTETNPGWAITLFVIIILVEIIESVVAVLHVHIAISADGIKYKFLNHSVNAKWTEVEGISQTKKTEQLVVNRPPYSKSDTIFKLLPDNIRKKLRQKSYIPLSWFAKNWRDSELGQQIKQYAPHLFEKEPSPLQRTSTN